MLFKKESTGEPPVPRCMMRVMTIRITFFLLFITSSAFAQPTRPTTLPASLQSYFRAQVKVISDKTRHTLSQIKTPNDWAAQKPVLRQQLAEMLGLHPMPARTELKPVITGTIDHDAFTVEKLHFQSAPGLYVTANLYIPKNLTAPAPAILYVCGHGNIKKDGISYGSKTSYQHHPAWFARNGYVCLILDTLQLGEIEGHHHGTNRLKMWWWHSIGYTPAGIETWNGIRALDYLQSRKEVDGERIGITGRSGGGAYSWFIAAMDDRVKVAVPVAGITDLQNHVVDNCIEGHCDCMYFVNTYRWDFPLLAALVAPRPLLIGNTDKDTIFPLDGVYRIHDAIKPLYTMHKANGNLGLLITEGPHKDTQELQVPAFRWFNRHLKKDEANIVVDGLKPFQPEQLKVARELPSDHINTTIHHYWIKSASLPPLPKDAQAWETHRESFLKQLSEKTFAAWPDEPALLGITQLSDRSIYEFDSEPGVRLKLHFSRGSRATSMNLHIVDETEGGGENALMMAVENGRGCAVIGSPRGSGREWPSDERTRTHLRRRFALLGQTDNSMRVYDIRRALQAIRQIDELKDLPIHIHASGNAAALTLYATLYEPPVEKLILTKLPPSHSHSPDLLNVQKVLDIPTTLALAASRTKIEVITSTPKAFSYTLDVARELNWPKDQLVLSPPESPTGR